MRQNSFRKRMPSQTSEQTIQFQGVKLVSQAQHECQYNQKMIKEDKTNRSICPQQTKKQRKIRSLIKIRPQNDEAQSFQDFGLQQSSKLNSNNKSRKTQQKLLTTQYLLLLVVNKIQQSKAYQRGYIIFLIPFLLIVAEVLSFDKKDSRETYLKQIFNKNLKNLQKRSKQAVKGFTQAQCRDFILICLKYRQNSFSIKSIFKKFLNQNKGKIKTFIPYYWQYFELIANRDQFFGQTYSVAKVNQLIKQVEIKVKKYNNPDL